jgi:hypothetical protein
MEGAIHSGQAKSQLYRDTNECQMGTALGFEVSQVKTLQKNEGDEQG